MNHQDIRLGDLIGDALFQAIVSFAEKRICGRTHNYREKLNTRDHVEMYNVRITKNLILSLKYLTPTLLPSCRTVLSNQTRAHIKVMPPSLVFQGMPLAGVNQYVIFNKAW